LSDFLDRESKRAQTAAQERASSNKAFWYLIFDGGGLSYSELRDMDAATFYECLAAKSLYVAELKKKN
jgi:hypothetical protein